jgi:hypothetical protein
MVHHLQTMPVSPHCRGSRPMVTAPMCLISFQLGIGPTLRSSRYNSICSTHCYYEEALLTSLVQQTMYRIIQAIASMYPDDRRETFEQAAATFRIPYWDWAAKPPSGDGVLPLSIGGSPTVDADGPNGIQTIANPLFSYTFKPLNASAFTDWPVRCLFLKNSQVLIGSY